MCLKIGHVTKFQFYCDLGYPIFRQTQKLISHEELVVIPVSELGTLVMLFIPTILSTTSCQPSIIKQLGSVTVQKPVNYSRGALLEDEVGKMCTRL